MFFSLPYPGRQSREHKPPFSHTRVDPRTRNKKPRNKKRTPAFSCPDLCQVLGTGLSRPQWSLLCPPTHLPRRVQPGAPFTGTDKAPGDQLSVNRGPPLATEENVFSSPEPLEGGPPSWPQFRSLGGGDYGRITASFHLQESGRRKKRLCVVARPATPVKFKDVNTPSSRGI